jgi:hypothetical protein
MTTFDHSHPHTICDSLHLAAAVNREAAGILLRLINRINVVDVTEHRAKIEAELPLALLERLCVWGSPFEDLEPEPWEDDGDAQPDWAA